MKARAQHAELNPALPARSHRTGGRSVNKEK